MRQRTFDTMSVGLSVGLLVTQTFDEPPSAPIGLLGLIILCSTHRQPKFASRTLFVLIGQHDQVYHIILGDATLHPVDFVLSTAFESRSYTSYIIFKDH